MAYLLAQLYISVHDWNSLCRRYEMYSYQCPLKTLHQCIYSLFWLLWVSSGHCSLAIRSWLGLPPWVCFFSGQWGPFSWFWTKNPVPWDLHILTFLSCMGERSLQCLTLPYPLRHMCNTVSSHHANCLARDQHEPQMLEPLLCPVPKHQDPLPHPAPRPLSTIWCSAYRYCRTSSSVKWCLLPPYLCGPLLWMVWSYDSAWQECWDYCLHLPPKVNLLLWCFLHFCHRKRQSIQVFSMGWSRDDFPWLHPALQYCIPSRIQRYGREILLPTQCSTHGTAEPSVLGWQSAPSTSWYPLSHKGRHWLFFCRGGLWKVKKVLISTRQNNATCRNFIYKW